MRAPGRACSCRSCIMAIFYFLVVRAHAQAAEGAAAVIEKLKKGDRVVTPAASTARSPAIDCDTVILKIADNVRVKVAKSAIAGLEKRRGQSNETQSALARDADSRVDRHWRWRSSVPPEKKIKLGLDLQGGMHLVLQVHTEDALRAETDSDMERLVQLAQEEGLAGLQPRRTGDDRFEIAGLDRRGAWTSWRTSPRSSHTGQGGRWQIASRGDGRMAFDMNRAGRDRDPQQRGHPGASRRSTTASTPSAWPSRSSRRPTATASSSSSPAWTIRSASAT